MTENLDTGTSSATNENFDWEKYYQTKIDTRFGARYEAYHYWRLLENYQPWLEVIESYLRKDSKVCEIGLGAGTGLITLAQHGFDCVGVDKQFLFPFVEKNARAVGVYDRFRFVDADMASLPFGDKEFDVTFSQGMLEHYSEDEIVLGIKEMLRVGKKLIMSVPTELAKNVIYRKELGLTGLPTSSSSTVGNVGDEKFWPVGKWEELIQKAGGQIEKKWSYWIPRDSAPELYEGRKKEEIFSETIIHPRPEDLEKYYGKGLLSCWVIS